MSKLKLLTGTAAAILLGMILVGLVTAQARSHAALTGVVTSQAEGPMEGVIVGAKKMGSTITTWVVSNAKGRYIFPSGRLGPGEYAISIRAVGYELPKTSIDLTGKPGALDLRLNKLTSPMKLAMQLSNAEWIMSIPGTHQQKSLLGGCTTCHTMQRIMLSQYTDSAMLSVVQLMAMYTNNSSSAHPWMRPPSKARPPSQRQIETAKYISSINLSSTGKFNFPLKTLPRPKGKATQVIYTTYDLPRPDAAPHDVELDAQGNVWYSDFTSQFIGKLDPKTGKVTDYPVPLGRTGPYAQGGLQLAIDKEGLIYYGNMSQMQIVRFDPKTEKMQTFKPPITELEIGNAHLTMIDPWFQDVDGWIWVNVAQGTQESGGTWHVDLATNTWTRVTYPPGSPSARAYDVAADSKNNMFGMNQNNKKIWMTNGKTLKTVWHDVPPGGDGCRRGHVDSQDRLWCGDFNGNGLVMFDPKTGKITEWKVPTPWTRPYDAEFDDKTYDWGAGMDSDLAVRLNTKTGEFTQYLLPHETNARDLEVQKSGRLSSLWLGDQHGPLIIHVQPLAP
ncbi:MAG: carboxypeptidase regulatory-like domain-containing protein [Terriglobia bacterium]